MSALVYRNALLLTQDPVLGELTGDLLITDGRIADIGRGIEVPEHAESVDATGLVIVPGFIDTHRHMWETTLRGAAAWEDWIGYARIIRSEFGGLVTPEDVYAGDLLGAIGALEAGITTIRDESHVQNSPEHTEAVLQGLVDGGGRAVLAYGWPSIDTYAWRAQDNPRRHPTYIREVYGRGPTAGDGRVSFALMLRGPELSGIEAARADLEFARQLGLRSSMHVGGVESSRLRGIEALAREGLLGPDLLFVHCCATSDEELRMIADSGGNVSVAAYIELAMPGLGAPATSRLMAAGIRPSLSIDAEPSAPGDMFSVMRAALLADSAAQVFTGTSPAIKLTERDVLAFATIEGARACGLDHEIGSLTPGKAADLAVLDLRQPGVSAAVDPVSAVVNYGHPGAVVDVVVAGRHVKRDGRMVDQALVDRAVGVAEQSRDRLMFERTRLLKSAAAGTAIPR
ncbi:amidohydrolase family protein [Nocardia carnea]|uniref:amidohydrolase family protein n=1 Tax=Nocardia carnea TaxID=37328 RepID=UPI0024549F38|nr:amidohydrolase family protein [Nocardia carnea]